MTTLFPLAVRDIGGGSILIRSLARPPPPLLSSLLRSTCAKTRKSNPSVRCSSSPETMLQFSGPDFRLLGEFLILDSDSRVLGESSNET
jgi:hypothetical protein